MPEPELVIKLFGSGYSRPNKLLVDVPLGEGEASSIQRLLATHRNVRDVKKFDNNGTWQFTVITKGLVKVENIKRQLARAIAEKLGDFEFQLVTSSRRESSSAELHTFDTEGWGFKKVPYEDPSSLELAA